MEVRINDMLNTQLFDPKESLDILVSFSIAEEGTNTLYLRLIDSLIRRTEEYSIVEIEMILNYFPHLIWTNEHELSTIRQLFYRPVLESIHNNLPKLDKR